MSSVNPRRAAIGGALLLALLCLASSAATAGKPPMTPRQAVKALRSGKDVPEAVATLEARARSGDRYACLVIGIVRLDGKLAPQDKPLGLAFLRLGATTGNAFVDSNPELGRQLQEAIALNEAGMTARELLESDRRLGELTAEASKTSLDAFVPRLTYYTPVRPVGTWPDLTFGRETVQIKVPPEGELPTYVRRGCALGGPGCPPDSVPDGSSRCTGVIPPPDRKALTRGTGTRLPNPTYPDEARRAGVDGAVALAIHVDASGWICSVLALDPDYSPPDVFSQSTLKTVVQWRLLPALRDGKPVEALQIGLVQFRLY